MLVRELKRDEKVIDHPLFGLERKILPTWSDGHPSASALPFDNLRGVLITCAKEVVIPYRRGMMKSHDHRVERAFIEFETPSDGQDAVANLVGVGSILTTTKSGHPDVDGKNIEKNGLAWCGKLTTIQNMLKREIKTVAEDLELTLDDIAVEIPSDKLPAEITPDKMGVYSNGEVDIEMGMARPLKLGEQVGVGESSIARRATKWGAMKGPFQMAWANAWENGTMTSLRNSATDSTICPDTC